MFAVAVTEYKEKLCQTAGQTKVTQDKMPLQPSVVELDTQFVFPILKLGIKPSEGGSQGGSQQRDPLRSKAMNKNIRLASGLFQSWLNAEKGMAGSGPFQTVTPQYIPCPSFPSTHICCRATRVVQSGITALETWLPMATINPQPRPSGTFDLVDY